MNSQILVSNSVGSTSSNNDNSSHGGQQKRRCYGDKQERNLKPIKCTVHPDDNKNVLQFVSFVTQTHTLTYTHSH